VPALIELLQDAGQVVALREGAIKSLAAIGPPAKEAIAALKAALDDPDADIRKAAEIALRAVEPRP
jgi:HEAT repeat protein